MKKMKTCTWYVIYTQQKSGNIVHAATIASQQHF